MASDRQEIQSEKHVRPKLGVCSADQNISESDRAKDVEHFDEIFGNFINETDKHEGRFEKPETKRKL